MPPRGSGKKTTAGTKIPPKTSAQKATKANVAQPTAIASGSGSVDPQKSPPITPPPAQQVTVFPMGEYVLPRLRNESPGEDFGTMSDDGPMTPVCVAPILVSPIRTHKVGSQSINKLTDLRVWKLENSEIIGMILSLSLPRLF